VSDNVHLEMVLGSRRYTHHHWLFRALQVVQTIQWELVAVAEDVPGSAKLARTVQEFRGYITANETFLANYGER
jgi:hypothetical protein